MAINLTLGGAGEQQVFTDDNFSGGANATNWTDPDIGIIALAKKTAEHVASAFVGKSNTSLTIGTGSKTLTTDVLRAYHFESCLVKIYATDDETKWMKGEVTAADATTGETTVNVTSVNGSGTYDDWFVTLDIAGQYSAATESAALAAEWATKTGSTVADSEYSAKEYAEGSVAPSAKQWATKTGSTVADSEYSAKEYASGSTVPTGSAKEWASTAEDSVVADGKYSALHYSAKAEDYATAAYLSETNAGSISRLAWTYINQNTNAVANSRYLADSSGGTFIVTLPSSPSVNDFVAIADGGNFTTHNLTVQSSGGKTIATTESQITLSIAYIFVFFVWSGSTWRIIVPGTGYPVLI